MGFCVGWMRLSSFVPCGAALKILLVVPSPSDIAAISACDIVKFSEIVSFSHTINPLYAGNPKLFAPPTQFALCSLFSAPQSIPHSAYPQSRRAIHSFSCPSLARSRQRLCMEGPPLPNQMLYPAASAYTPCSPRCTQYSQISLPSLPAQSVAGDSGHAFSGQSLYPHAIHVHVSSSLSQ